MGDGEEVFLATSPRASAGTELLITVLLSTEPFIIKAFFSRLVVLVGSEDLGEDLLEGQAAFNLRKEKYT